MTSYINPSTKIATSKTQPRLIARTLFNRAVDRIEARPAGLKCKTKPIASKTTNKFNPHPGHVVASLDKTLYDDCLCLVASNKQQIYVERSQRSIGKLGKWSTPKRVRIRPKDSATVAFS